MARGKKLGPMHRKLLDFAMSRPPGSIITSQELYQVGKDQVHWQRRWRELRDVFGYRIRSDKDRQDLAPGEYILESFTPDPPKPRLISQQQRARILAKYPFCCVCGRVAGDPNPLDPGRAVRLDVDHIVAVEQGGSNDDENLCTLCNICNNGKSNVVPINRDLMAGTSLMAQLRRAPRPVKQKALDFLSMWKAAEHTGK